MLKHENPPVRIAAISLLKLLPSPFTLLRSHQLNRCGRILCVLQGTGNVFSSFLCKAYALFVTSVSRVGILCSQNAHKGSFTMM